ncbi:MAG: arylesterase [Firmicutes bacterium]|jgi:lysophospholipase L1-like esterase|nr:arylesterase [Bacillota bacterium]
MKKKLMFFGDSNTYGFDPQSFWGYPYERDIVWTTKLAKAHPDWEVYNCGQNGREIPHSKMQYDFLDREMKRLGPLDLFGVMLGSNDLFCMVHPTAEAITARMNELVWFVKEHPSVTEETKILVIAPAWIRLGPGVDPAIEQSAYGLGAAMKKMAEEQGVAFADAWGWEIALGRDGMHFSPEGHHQFYEQMERVLAELM